MVFRRQLYFLKVIAWSCELPWGPVRCAPSPPAARAAGLGPLGREAQQPECCVFVYSGMFPLPRSLGCRAAPYFSVTQPRLVGCSLGAHAGTRCSWDLSQGRWSVPTYRWGNRCLGGPVRCLASLHDVCKCQSCI